MLGRLSRAFALFMNWFDGICASVCGVWMMASAFFTLPLSWNDWMPASSLDPLPIPDLMKQDLFWAGFALLLVNGVPNVIALVFRFRGKLAVSYRWASLRESCSFSGPCLNWSSFRMGCLHSICCSVSFSLFQVRMLRAISIEGRIIVINEESVEMLVHQLRSPNNKVAYCALKSLVEASGQSDEVYHYMDTFIEMMSDQNSYVRTRGLTLIACNARWDEAGKIEKIIDEYLEHVTDEKPITARQCVKALAQVAEEKPQLTARISDALRHADLSKYTDSMRPLVQGDICDVLLTLNSLK